MMPELLDRTVAAYAATLLGTTTLAVVRAGRKRRATRAGLAAVPYAFATNGGVLVAAAFGGIAVIAASAGPVAALWPVGLVVAVARGALRRRAARATGYRASARASVPPNQRLSALRK